MRGSRFWAAVLLAVAVASANAESLTDAQPQRDLQPCTPAGETRDCLYVPREVVREGGERRWHAQVEGRDVRTGGEKLLGVALAGGGSKSAPFAMGVLAGLHDERLLLPRGAAGAGPEDVIVASVSGGGYSAYHLFTQLWWSKNASGNPGWDRWLETAYRDCLTKVPQEFSPGLKEGLADDACDRVQRKYPAWNAEQYKLRCAQDLLQAGECNFLSKGLDGVQTIGNTSLILVPTILSLPIHHTLNTLFDSGINVSPSQLMYRSGIGLTYGSVADRTGSVTGPDSELLNCADGADAWPATGARTLHCFGIVRRADTEDARVPQPRGYYVVPQPLSFEGLKDLRQGERKAPLWVIQATAPRYRSLGGWLTEVQPDMANDVYEMTAYGRGSRRYGFVAQPPQGLSALDATVSAAAFFDANQTVYNDRLTRGTIGVGVHAFNMNWGVDVPNPSVTDARRAIHRLVPFPFYWLDSLLAQRGEEEPQQDRLRSAFIRLVDGGSADNSGIYALLRRGVGTIVYADASEDTRGRFEELCKLHVALRNRGLEPVDGGKEKFGVVTPLYLNMPGLRGLDGDCHEKKRSWNLYADWEHELPVLVGCVSHVEGDCGSGGGVVSRLVVVKPRIGWNLASPNAGGHHNAFERAVDWKSGTAHRCVQDGTLLQAVQGGSLHRTSCRGPDGKVHGMCKAALPCEVVRHVLEGVGKERPSNRDAGFPQASTVLQTANSNSEFFAASRELARHYTRMASDVIRDAMDHQGHRDFEAAIRNQSEKNARTPRASGS